MELKGAAILNFRDLIKYEQTSLNGLKVSIPHYQRPYSWDEEFIKRLISDWNKQNKESYFTGAIVTVKNEFNQEVIDGQQRFTTVFLVNFTRFILLRVYIREIVITGKLSKLLRALEAHRECCALLFEQFDKELHQRIGDGVGDLIDKFHGESTTEQERESFLTSIKDLLSGSLSIPMISESNEDYENSVSDSLKTQIGRHKLKLDYSRKSYCEQLTIALSSSIVKLSTQAEQSIAINSPQNDSISCKYTDAIEVIFNAFKDLAKGSGTNSSDPLNLCGETIRIINHFLENIQFCLIQTGKAEDAYVLFEVLNDRALALNDLDLIKNQFYKKFCHDNNQGLSESEIDEIIENKESQWGESIFDDNIRKGQSTLIIYLAAAYFTGQGDLKYSGNERYRESISNYFNLSDNVSYETGKFTRDLNIIQCIKEMVDKVFRLPLTQRHKAAIKVEYENNCSQVAKSFYLFNALNQQGVMSGLVAVILNYIHKHIDENFAPDKCLDFLNQLKQKGHSYSDIENTARSLMQLSLQSRSAEVPRAYAVELIESNHLLSSKVDYRTREALTNSLKSEFQQWLHDWRYSNSDVKVRVLFARLLRNSDPSLNETPFSFKIADSDIENLHLDHMEPSSVPKHSTGDYFIDDEREMYVNGIGNMFPLPGNINISKGNQPFVTAFAALERSGLKDHWLKKITQEIFESSNNNEVPSRKFFDKRKNYLKEAFYKALDT